LQLIDMCFSKLLIAWKKYSIDHIIKIFFNNFNILILKIKNYFNIFLIEK
jgi:hypothetical protein